MARLPLRPCAWLLALVLLLAGCGGGGDDDGGDGGSTPVLGQPADEPEAARSLGFPGFATRNTTRVGGADPVADAAGVAQAVYPARSPDTRPPALVVVDQDDWRSAISASQLMASPLRAPVLFSAGGQLPEASESALRSLAPGGAPKAGGAQVIRVGPGAARPAGMRVADVEGTDYAAAAVGIDKLHTAAVGGAGNTVVIAPADDPAFAMPAAGWAAKSGDPVLWSGRTALPAATRAALEAKRRAGRVRIYVLGPPAVISDAVLAELGKLGRAQRIAGRDPVANAIAFARFTDGPFADGETFGWGVVDPGHGIVFASTRRPAEAAAAAPLSATGTYGPLLLLPDANALPEAVQNYLLDIQPGYRGDPVRGVYNHGWLMGDATAISVDVQARIDTLLEIQPVDDEDA